MSIIISDLSYCYPNQPALLSNLNFSVEKQEKVSIIGNNGAGKSTLLKIMAGELSPTGGDVVSTSTPYYLAQHTGMLAKTVAEMLGVDKKLAALQAIEKGSVSQSDYDTLNDDWEIESTCHSAFSYWKLSHIQLDMNVDDLSGGEKTKIFLAGLFIHQPEIILLDEPTNHLDQSSRELLYQYVRQSKAAIVIVSHDITLLNQIEKSYELSEQGLKLYGGNYDFFKEQKRIAVNALNKMIDEQEKTLRLAQKKAQEVQQKQEKRSGQGKKRKVQEGAARIVLNALGGSAENTAAKLKDKHSEIIGDNQTKLTELRQQRERIKELKIKFDNTALHSGKLLVEAIGINYEYISGKPLWETALDFKLYSHDRIHILGDNGSGKTSFVRLLTGSLTPSCGQIKHAHFSWIYLDQNYTQTDADGTIIQLAEQYNANHLEEHELKLRLNRFLFPANSWNKRCKTLSGGEKMRLCLCCLMIQNQTPDLIVLDEPTNNLDISSLQILMQTIKNYCGSLLVISHDQYFVNEIGIDQKITLPYR